MLFPSAPLREALDFNSSPSFPLVSSSDDKNDPKNIHLHKSTSFNHPNVINQLLSQTTAMAKVITKSSEKEDIGKAKVKSVEFEDLHKFLSSYTCDSEMSAVYQVPKELIEELSIFQPLEAFRTLPIIIFIIISHLKNLIA